jgi:hypothetical protein
MDLRALHDRLQLVCPIVGVSVGKLADKATWRIDFAPEATAEQRTAAQAALQAFDPDAPAMPASVKMWQAKAALAAAGKLDAANAAVTGSNNQAIILAWEYAPDLNRNTAAVAAIGQAIGLDAAALDALFIAASQIAV